MTSITPAEAQAYFERWDFTACSSFAIGGFVFGGHWVADRH
jgi:hypothetical protein